MKHMLTTKEIIEKGDELNRIHSEYKNATPKEKPEKWQNFYDAWMKYRADVNDYVKTIPTDISDSL